MSESYVYTGSPPKTREDMVDYIYKSGCIVAKLEVDIYERERKRQAAANLLTRYPEKNYFSDEEIKKEAERLKTEGEDFEHDYL